MLTKEILLANATLAGLSAEQLEAIATLSQNDEAAVFGSEFVEGAVQHVESGVEPHLVDGGIVAKVCRAHFYGIIAQPAANAEEASGAEQQEGKRPERYGGYRVFILAFYRRYFPCICDAQLRKCRGAGKE